MKGERTIAREEKQLLLKDLCARLPYGVKCEIIRDFWGGRERMSLKPVTEILNGKTYHLFATNTTFGATDEGVISVIPYLRPLLSMTEEEKEEMKEVIEIELTALEGPEGFSVATAASSAFEIDFYNKHHLDYRGLIEKGLALEAPQGMY